MTMPTFLIIGAMKAGTTTLFRLLDQHPEVYMSPVKEPNFYAYKDGRPKRGHPPGMPYPVWIIDTPDLAERAMEKRVDAATFTTLPAYQRLWQDVSEPQKGEASVLYLYLPHVAESIASMDPSMKLVAILRNPVERAYSHFLMARRMGREPIASFIEAMEAEASRLAQDYDPFWHYRSLGYYSVQLERYFKVFDRSQILIMFNDDLKKDLYTAYARLLRFLEVDASFEPGPKKEYGIGGQPKSRWLYRLATSPSLIKDYFKRIVPAQYHASILNRFVLSKPELEIELRQQLARFYHDDILRLEDLIGRDLSFWRTNDHQNLGN
ncbi:MAG: sulfotransferase domain-containing protein [Anaerolineales bacterium]|nr:sulfotransferase domain-containing protein [Anaerolineales bacterium]